jgi:hypothetical protein
LILSGTEGVSDVDGSAATPAVRGADANTGIFFPAADTIAFAEGGVEVARITNTAAWSFGASGTATGTNGQVLTSAGSSAAPAWQTPTVTSPAGSTGQVQINNAGAFGAVGSGTTGQVLTSQGTGAAPVFATPSVGALVLLQSVTASNSATVELTSISSTYDNYLIVASNISHTGTSNHQMRVRMSGSWVSANYNYHLANPSFNSPAYSAVNSGDATQVVVATGGFGDNGTLNYEMFLFNLNSTTRKKSFAWQGANNDDSRSYVGGAGNYFSLNAITGVQFFAASGNIVTGTFRLYGIANS